jgi:hypothetical protein
MKIDKGWLSIGLFAVMIILGVLLVKAGIIWGAIILGIVFVCGVIYAILDQVSRELNLEYDDYGTYDYDYVVKKKPRKHKRKQKKSKSKKHKRKHKI